MKTKYENKHAELSWISSVVRRFFESKGLCVKEYDLKGRHCMEASLEGLASVLFAVVEFYVEARDILIDFLPLGKKERGARTSLLASTLPLIGGGIFVSRDLTNKELMQKVENEFWDYLDAQIANLTQ